MVLSNIKITFYSHDLSFHHYGEPKSLSQRKKSEYISSLSKIELIYNSRKLLINKQPPPPLNLTLE